MTQKIGAPALLALVVGASAIAFSAMPQAAAEVAAPRFGTWGFDASGEDPGVAPGADFFRFANGAWYDREQIPADRSRFGNFDALNDLSEARTRRLIEAAAANPGADPDAAKVGDAYKAFMNQALVDRLDDAPLQPDLDAIRAETSPTDVAALMGRSTVGFQGSIFDLAIDTDRKTPTRYAVDIDAGGLGMPDRDFYLQPQFADKKIGYQAYVSRQLAQVGWADPDAAAKAVVDFETSLAAASWSRADRRDVDKSYHPMSVAALTVYAPGFDFKAFLREAGLGDVDRVIVASDTAFPRIAATFAATPIDTLRAWQTFHLLDAASPYLADRFVQARYRFRGKLLSGQPEIQPRWKRAVGFVNGALGEDVGRLYVADYFTPRAKAEMDALVGNVKAALAARIGRASWMTPETRAKALLKLSKLTVKIGYPVKWRDYSALTITADDLYGDAKRAAAFEWRRQVARMNGPVDKLEWDMTPQTVNAYYQATNNEIVFPAAILQPPFFDPGADPAINYGGIGGVIGHEMTHGFDDQGRKVDGDGRLSDWWTPADAEQFKVQAARLAAQFSMFEPLPGAHVNGDLTLGENIADLGGILLALDAYHASLNGRPAPVIDGLTGDQRVFLGWAQVWRMKRRDDNARQQVVADPHAPERFRVNGPFRNVDAWYDAFGVKPGDALYLPPDQRVRIW